MQTVILNGARDGDLKVDETCNQGWKQQAKAYGTQKKLKNKPYAEA